MAGESKIQNFSDLSQIPGMMEFDLRREKDLRILFLTSDQFVLRKWYMLPDAFDEEHLLDYC